MFIRRFRRSKKGYLQRRIYNSVTDIGRNAFWNCISLKEVIIPNSIIVIGEGVFNNCPSLREIKVEEGISNEVIDRLTNDYTDKEIVVIKQNVTSKKSSNHSSTLESILAEARGK